VINLTLPGMPNVCMVCIISAVLTALLMAAPQINRRFPGVVSLTFKDTYLFSIAQLNALGSVRRLEHLTLGDEEPLVQSLSLWRRYVVFRLGHLPLKKSVGLAERTVLVMSKQNNTESSSRALAASSCFSSQANHSLRHRLPNKYLARWPLLLPL